MPFPIFLLGLHITFLHPNSARNLHLHDILRFGEVDARPSKPNEVPSPAYRGINLPPKIISSLILIKKTQETPSHANHLTHVRRPFYWQQHPPRTICT